MDKNDHESKDRSFLTLPACSSIDIIYIDWKEVCPPY